MKIFTLAAAAFVAATPAVAQVVTPTVVDTNPVVANVDPGARAVRMVRGAGQDPVLISGETVISATQPLDLDLTPVPGMEFAFTNASGQIVIVAPADRSIQYFDN